MWTRERQSFWYLARLGAPKNVYMCFMSFGTANNANSCGECMLSVHQNRSSITGPLRLGDPMPRQCKADWLKTDEGIWLVMTRVMTRLKSCHTCTWMASSRLVAALWACCCQTLVVCMGHDPPLLTSAVDPSTIVLNMCTLGQWPW